MNQPTFLSRLPIRSLEFSCSFGSYFVEVDMTKMRICSTEKGRKESREEKRRGEEKASCAFTAVCTLPFLTKKILYFAGGATPPRWSPSASTVGSTLPSRTTYQSAKATYRLQVIPWKCQDMTDRLGWKINFARNQSSGWWSEMVSEEGLRVCESARTAQLRGFTLRPLEPRPEHCPAKHVR